MADFVRRSYARALVEARLFTYTNVSPYHELVASTQVISRRSRVGGWKLTGFLGSGGFADVYRAEDADGTLLAVKVLRLSPDSALANERHRFEREREILARVCSPYVAHLRAADLETEVPWIATEFVDGPSLRGLLESSGPLSMEQASTILLKLGAALAEVHGMGIVHRDISPDNVLLDQRGPVLIDFGIAHLEEAARLTVPGAGVGTPGFAAPEVIAGLPGGPPADVYGLARLFLFMTGQEAGWSRKGPHDRGNADMIEQALDPDPSARPHLADFIAQLSAGLSTDVPPPPLPKRVVRPLPRRFRLRSLIGAGIVTAIVAMGVSIPVVRHYSSVAAVSVARLVAEVDNFGGGVPAATHPVQLGGVVKTFDAGMPLNAMWLPPDVENVEALGLSLQRWLLYPADESAAIQVDVRAQRIYERDDVNGLLAGSEKPEPVVLPFQSRAQTYFQRYRTDCASTFSEPRDGFTDGQPSLSLAATCRGEEMQLYVEIALPDIRATVQIGATMAQSSQLSLSRILDSLKIDHRPVVMENVGSEEQLVSPSLVLAERPDAPFPPYLWRYALDIPPHSRVRLTTSDPITLRQSVFGVLASPAPNPEFYIPLGQIDPYFLNSEATVVTNATEEPLTALVEVSASTHPAVPPEIGVRLDGDDSVGNYYELRDLIRRAFVEDGDPFGAQQETPPEDLFGEESDPIIVPVAAGSSQIDERGGEVIEYLGTTLVLPPYWFVNYDEFGLITTRFERGPAEPSPVDIESIQLLAPSRTSELPTAWLEDHPGLSGCEGTFSTAVSSSMRLDYVTYRGCFTDRGTVGSLPKFAATGAVVVAFVLYEGNAEIQRGRAVIGSAEGLGGFVSTIRALRYATS